MGAQARKKERLQKLSRERGLNRGTYRCIRLEPSAYGYPSLDEAAWRRHPNFQDRDPRFPDDDRDDEYYDDEFDDEYDSDDDEGETVCDDDDGDGDDPRAADDRGSSRRVAGSHVESFDRALLFDERPWSQLSTAERARLSRLQQLDRQDDSLSAAWARARPLEFVLVAATVCAMHYALHLEAGRGDLVVDPAVMSLKLHPPTAAAVCTAMLFTLPEHWHYCYVLSGFGGDDPMFRNISPGPFGFSCLLIEALRFMEPQGAMAGAARLVAARWLLWAQWSKWLLVLGLGFLTATAHTAWSMYSNNLLVTPSIVNRRCVCPECVRKYNLEPIQLLHARCKATPFFSFYGFGLQTSFFWGRLFCFCGGRVARYWVLLLCNYGLRYLCLGMFLVMELLTIPFELGVF